MATVLARRGASSAAARKTPGHDSGISLGIVLTLVAVGCLVVTQAIDFGFFQLRIGVLNSDTHASIFGAASLVAQCLAALAAAARSRVSSPAIGWIVVSGLTALLVVVRVGISFRAVVLLVPVAAVFVLSWYLTSADPKPARTVVRVGLAALVFSYVVHAFGPHVVAALGYSGNTWPYQIKGILKHSTELGGWMLVALGFFRGRPRAASPER